MRFKTWFEEMTSTADVAVFARPCMPMVKRGWTTDEEDKPKKKRKKKKKE
jgi:hypothetical protein